MRSLPPRRAYWLILTAMMLWIMSVAGCVHGFTTGNPFELFMVAGGVLGGLILLFLGKKFAE